MIKNNYILGLICARGGSKGIPGKNLKPLDGKPLIGWSIDAAKACPLIDRIVVSTEDNDIADTARSYGAWVPFMRPDDMAKDNSPIWPVWQHALTVLRNKHEFTADVLVDLPPTSPFRSSRDITNSIELLYASDADIIISVKQAGRNPYFNMVEMDDKGYACLSKSPASKIVRRQDAPIVYDMTTVVYTARSEFILCSNGIFEGKVKVITIPEERAVDLDTEMDWKFAEFLLQEGLVCANG